MMVEIGYKIKKCLGDLKRHAVTQTVVMLAKDRHGEHKNIDKKNIYIQVTETRYT